jgi:two-component system, NarL family, sensor histidine kinase DesK
MDASIKSTAIRLRSLLIPDRLDLGWMPFFWLCYLGFLFFPGFMHRSDHGQSPEFARGWNGMPDGMLLPTLLSIAVFLPLYFYGFNRNGRPLVPVVLAIAGLGYAVLPYNLYGNTYIIYAAVFAPFIGSLRAALSLVIGILVVFSFEVIALGAESFLIPLTAIISLACCVGNHFFNVARLKQAALKLSHDEVRRLAQLAERERIGRDLHDLLGHTLSLIALKAELASRLWERDPHAARQEIGEVERVAREALAQVRRAVSGIRAAGLQPELASAKLMLESVGVRFEYRCSDTGLPVEIETVLAMAVREAVTNIQRHAHARHATIALEINNDALLLSIHDDGRGGAIVPGNGLAGMRERLHAIGATLSIQSQPRRGTRLEIRLSLPAHSASATTPDPRARLA